MSSKTKIKNIKELCIVAFLITVILIRFRIADDDATWIAVVNYSGFLISIFDVLTESLKKSSVPKKFSFLVMGTIIFIALMVPLALLWTNFVTITSKWNDTFTLLALMFSLGKNMFVDLIVELILC